jgi:hypothetical protein
MNYRTNLEKVGESTLGERTETPKFTGESTFGDTISKGASFLEGKLLSLDASGLL